jgi:hypothetical protein
MHCIGRATCRLPACVASTGFEAIERTLDQRKIGGRALNHALSSGRKRNLPD